jgi:DNA-binding CsgD family transcriptional regulator
LRRILGYGLAGGVLIAVLKVVEYRHFVHAYPTELYGGLVAVVFTAVGIHLGARWHRRREVVVVREVEVPVEVPVPAAPAAGAPFAPDAGKLAELGITPREREILALIASGLSNREIGERAFISENTVKTHSSRLFDKLGVQRRVQAVQRGRELGLIP